jgi:4-carboxymuconolactone decarboxylase
MKLLAATALSLSLLASAFGQSNQTGGVSGPGAAPAARAEDSQMIKITRRGSQPSRQGPAENFTGAVRVDPLFQANAPARAYGALVTFEPGARTAWHTHPLGQVLIVTSGTGRVQRWGDPVDEIRQGDVVWIPPGQKHWHGATPGSSTTHIAISEQLDGKIVDWMEKVSDAQYGAPLRGQAASAEARPRPSQAAMGDFAPKLAEITDDVLYGDVWERPELSKRGPKPGDRGRADCLESPRPAPVSPRHRAPKRRDAGGVDRDHHSPGVLRWLAQRRNRHRRSQGSFRTEMSCIAADRVTGANL